MSYILDALKKVEHEKHKKSAPGGMTSIAGDLFQEQIQRPVRGGRWKVIILIFVVSSSTFAGTWFLLRDSKPKSNPLSSPAMPAVVVPAAPPSSPPAVASVAAPAPVQTVAVPPAANAIAPAVSPVPLTADADDEVRAPRAVKRPPKQSAAVVTSLPLKPSLQSVQPPADIKLSGIAWQDERAARRAVINGFLLKEGSVVSGAKVTEIMADRVRFLLPSGTFEVRLDASSTAEGKR